MVSLQAVSFKDGILTSLDVLLNQVDGFQASETSNTLSLPFAAEASWITGKWDKLKQCLSRTTEASEGDFNVGVARALLALSEDKFDSFSKIVDTLRQDAAKGLSATNTASLQACHDSMLKFHVLTEMELISGMQNADQERKSGLRTTLSLRLDILGPFLSDKQYILGLRRAVMELCK